MGRGVLLFGRPRDPHVLAVAAELRRRRKPAFQFDPRRYPAKTWINFTNKPGDRPGLELQGVDLDDVGAGWVGTQRTVGLSGQLAPATRRFAKAAALQGLDSFLRACPFPWVNDPDSAVRADDKVLQLAIAQRLGFDVPATLVTNDPDAFRWFHAKHPKLIAKAVAGSHGLPGPKRILTNLVTAADVAHAKDIQHSPVCFQEAVPKASELRVTVVGSQLFPVRIHSQATARTRVDWRRYGPALEYTPATLPQAVAGRCGSIAKELGLDYGGIDLIETPDGEHVFLEINTLPAWLWLEDATKAPITSALVDLLLRKAKAKRS